jgi:hypothetical protein
MSHDINVISMLIDFKSFQSASSFMQWLLYTEITTTFCINIWFIYIITYHEIEFHDYLVSWIVKIKRKAFVTHVYLLRKRIFSSSCDLVWIEFQSNVHWTSKHVDWTSKQCSLNIDVWLIEHERFFITF